MNRSPVVQSLIAFPTTIGPGDSAIIVCQATDPDGDTVLFDWFSDCRLISQYGGVMLFSAGNTLIVHPGSCVSPPDTGWVECEVRDGKGGGARAGFVYIVVHP